MEEQNPRYEASPVDLPPSTLPTPVKAASITLPSLHEAIPEFRSHTPARKSVNKPRGLTSLISPTSLPPHPFGSPSSPGRTIPDNLVNLATLPSPKRRRLSVRTSIGVPYPQTEAERDELRERKHAAPLTPHSRTTSVSGFFQPAERRQSVAGLPTFPPMQHSSMHPPQRHPSLISPRATSFDTPITPASADRQTFGTSYSAEQTPIFTSPFEKDRQYQNSIGEVLHRTPSNSNVRQHKLSPTSPNSSMNYPLYPSARVASGSLRDPTTPQERTPFSSMSHQSPIEHSDPYDQLRGGKRRRGNLPKQVTDLLRTWLHNHLHHPYPTEDQKQELVAQTGLTMNQISNWFINARRRRLPTFNSNATARSELDSRSHLAFLQPNGIRPSGSGPPMST